MEKPLLSIITPVYNCAKYLVYSLNSIFNQSCDDYFELILVDDNSTDGSDIILESYNHAKIGTGQIKLIKNKENKGCFKSRAIAIEASKGKYIAMHDADDYSFAYRFGKQVKFLEENKDIWCVGGHAHKIDINNDDYFENNEDNGNMDYPPEKNHDIIRKTIEGCLNPIIDSSTMFRREEYDRLGGYHLYKDIQLVADFELWTRAFMNNFKFYNFQEPFILYRVNPEGNTRSKKEEMIKQHMLIWRKFVRQWKLK